MRFASGMGRLAVGRRSIVSITLTGIAIVGLTSVLTAASVKPTFVRAGATAVSSPGISAPPDVVVGEADVHLDLPVSLSAPGTSKVSVNYATANGTAFSGTSCNNLYVG